MSLWRNVRAEMAGAWRSLCYDLGRRPEARDGAGPDVTSTGMSTFPGSLISMPVAPVVADGKRPPRRFVAVAAFCALAACGAAGSYLVATTAFAGRMTDPPAAVPEIVVPPRPPVFEAVPEPTHHGGARMGGTPRKSRAASPKPAAPVVTTTTQVVVTPDPTRENTRPTAPVTGPPECDCDTPPVPTPTAPSATPPASASPSAPADPSPSALPSLGGTVWIPFSDRRHQGNGW